MKFIPLLLLTAIICSCGNNASDKTAATNSKDSLPGKKDSTTAYLNPLWINDFREFRDAVYRDDIKKVKSYFKFPVLNRHNNLWTMISMNSKDAVKGANNVEVVPFTETDFDKYYKYFFSKEFKTSILKVKSDQLLKEDYVHTDSFETDSTHRYFMDASLDKEDNTLSLSVQYREDILDENGEFLDPGEFSTIYIFTIQPDGSLLFKEIMLAG